MRTDDASDAEGKRGFAPETGTTGGNVRQLRLRANRAAGAFPRWTLDHPYLIVAFYFAVFVLGAIAIGGALPRRFAPYVQSPTVGVVTMMPGLSAQEMELYVSKPIEEQLVNVKDLHYIRSTSQEGFSLVTVEFNYGVDMQRALFDVQALMNVIQANLPGTGANLKPSWVVPIDPLNIPILTLAVTGDADEGWTPQRVREFADNEAVNRLKRVPQVYSVVPFGGYRRQMQVVVDREKLAARGLSILDVKAAIDRFNVSRPGGTLTWQGGEGTVRVDARALSAEDIRAYPVRSTAGAGAGVPPAPAPATVRGDGGLRGGHRAAQPARRPGRRRRPRGGHALGAAQRLPLPGARAGNRRVGDARDLRFGHPGPGGVVGAGGPGGHGRRAPDGG